MHIFSNISLNIYQIQVSLSKLQHFHIEVPLPEYHSWWACSILIWNLRKAPHVALLLVWTFTKSHKPIGSLDSRINFISLQVSTQEVSISAPKCWMCLSPMEVHFEFIAELGATNLRPTNHGHVFGVYGSISCCWLPNAQWRLPFGFCLLNPNLKLTIRCHFFLLKLGVRSQGRSYQDWCFDNNMSCLRDI